MDNRTMGFRVVGQGASFRVENRMPGADANPYLAFAAMIAAGKAGVDESLDCPKDYKGNAYSDPSLSLPCRLVLLKPRIYLKAVGWRKKPLERKWWNFTSTPLV